MGDRRIITTVYYKILKKDSRCILEKVFRQEGFEILLKTKDSKTS